MKLSQTFPTCAGILFLFITAYFNCVMQIIAERRSPVGEDRLPDLLQSWLPYWDVPWLCDYLLIAAIGLTFLRFLFSNNRFFIFRRFCIVEGMLMIARGISIVITQLSQPQQDCESTISEPIFIEAFYLLFYVHHTCGDVMFSLHTATLTLLAMIWTLFSQNSEWALCFPSNFVNEFGLLRSQIIEPQYTFSFSLTVILVWCYSLFTYIIIIISHFHYSVDVFIGFIISYCFTRLYCHFVGQLEIRNDWIGKVFAWYEQDPSRMALLPSSNSPPPRRLSVAAEDSGSANLLLPSDQSSQIFNNGWYKKSNSPQIAPSAPTLRMDEHQQHDKDENEIPIYSPPPYRTIASTGNSPMNSNNNRDSQPLVQPRPLNIPRNNIADIVYETPSNRSDIDVITPSQFVEESRRRSPSISPQLLDMEPSISQPPYAAHQSPTPQSASAQPGLLDR